MYFSLKTELNEELIRCWIYIVISKLLE